MAINSGDVKLNASKVMLDVPEGGGGPTDNVIPDGTSNAIFLDISETDRVNGRVNARQVHVVIDTNNRDPFLGPNVIVSKPPDDPNVSITIFEADNPFETRAQAMDKIQSYFFMGPSFPGYLFGNHIAGMKTVTVFQKESTVPPSINDTMVLIKREGFNDEYLQYVRITSVDVSTVVFEDGSGSFTRNVMTLGISDPLRENFPGFDVSRFDISTSALAGKTKVCETIVADAATYSGIATLTEDADMTDFTVYADSIYTQLVPSAQIETPIADARTNQVTTALIAAGSPVTQSLVSIFTTTQSMFIGGAILPGTLSIVRSGITVTDDGGQLTDGTSQVGTIDYANGIATLLTNVFGSGSGTHAVTYTPAAVPTAPQQSQGFEVTSANRSQTYVRTLEPVPERGSLQVAYRSGGRWYELRDDGSGALRGTSSSFGVGMLNRTTGTVTLTLGALPDVDSSVIFTWVEPATEKANSQLVLDNDGNLYLPFNTDGDLSLEAGGDAIAPGGLTITWNDGTPRTASDNGEGSITGDATGTVNYGRGVVRISPNVLPPVGTTFNVAVDSAAKEAAGSPTTDAGSVMTFALAKSGIEPGTVWMTITVPLMFTFEGGPSQLWRNVTLTLADLQADGNLYLVDREGSVIAGDIDYASGTGTLIKNVPISSSNAAGFVGFDNIYENIILPPGIRGF